MPEQHPFDHYLQRLRDALEVSRGDPEAGHCLADDVLVAFVREFGTDELAEAFLAVEKWYA